MSIKSLFAPLAVCLALGVSAGAQAATDSAPSAPPATVSTTIHYADLNLDSHSGAKTMLHRIRFAAMELCGPADVLDGYVQYRACVHATVERAVRTLGNPVVLAMSGAVPGTGPVTLAANQR